MSKVMFVYQHFKFNKSFSFFCLLYLNKMLKLISFKNMHFARSDANYNATFCACIAVN